MASGISLGDSIGWRIVGATEPDRFLFALKNFITDDAILALHDPAGKEVIDFLRDHPAENPIAVSPGTLWPSPKIYYIRCTGSHLDHLVELALHHAEPEMASHIHVCLANSVIVEWYDAFEDPIGISRTMEEVAVNRFSDECGGKLEVAEA